MGNKEQKVKCTICGRVCPECKGTGKVDRSGRAYHCPTCNGTGKAQPVSGDVREQVARIICCFAKENNSCAECGEARLSPFPNCFDDIERETREILSLLQVKLPENMTNKPEALNPCYGSFVSGWNQCIAKLKELNGWIK